MEAICNRAKTVNLNQRQLKQSESKQDVILQKKCRNVVHSCQGFRQFYFEKHYGVMAFVRIIQIN